MGGEPKSAVELIFVKTTAFIKGAKMQKRFMNALAPPNRNYAVSQSVM